MVSSPAVSSRPFPPSRERLIQTAATLFYERGIHRTSVDLVVAEAGLTKPTFYKSFPSKDDLIEAVANYRSENWHRAIEEEVAAATTPRQRLIAVFDFLENFIADEGFRGCALVNASVEIHIATGPGREVARQNKLANRRRLEQLAKEAELPNPEPLAATLALLFEGAITSAYVEGYTEAGQVARRAAEALISDLGG